MATTRIQAFASVDDYIAAQPQALQIKLAQLRKIIRKAAPKADESIAYGMPAYKHHGPLVYFALFKQHLGLYPTPSAIAAFQKELAGYEVAKGTVRLPLEEPLPVNLITDVVKFRVKENEEKAALKAKAKKTKARI